MPSMYSSLVVNSFTAKEVLSWRRHNLKEGEECCNWHSLMAGWGAYQTILGHLASGRQPGLSLSLTHTAVHDDQTETVGTVV